MSRDSQLSSSVFDAEILALLSAQLGRSLSYFGPNTARNWKLESDAVLGGLIFYLSIWRRGKSTGQILQNVHYAGISNRQKVFLGLAFVGLPYVWGRINEKSIQDHWAEREEYVAIYRWMRRLDTAWKWFSLANFGAFLVQGKYPHLVERIVGAELREVTPDQPRAVAFDFMNRQLVWQGFTEFLLFFTPLIDFDKLTKFFRQRVANPSLPPTECGICGVNPICVPFGSKECGHASCYYCIAQKLLEDGDYPCPVCGIAITMDTLTRVK